MAAHHFAGLDEPATRQRLMKTGNRYCTVRTSVLDQLTGTSFESLQIFPIPHKETFVLASSALKPSHTSFSVTNSTYS